MTERSRDAAAGGEAAVPLPAPPKPLPHLIVRTDRVQAITESKRAYWEQSA